MRFTSVEPTRIFDSKAGLDLKFGSETALLRFPGVGHSVDNLLVFLPKRGLLFGGCMLLAAEANKPGNVADGDQAAWLKSLRGLKTDGIKLVVPGHGEPGGIGLVSHTIEVLSAPAM